MTKTLIILHANDALPASTANLVTAAQKIGGDVDVLVFGGAVDTAATSAAHIAGVGKVFKAANASFKDAVAECVTPTLLDAVSAYTHVLMNADAVGKTILPRLAALCDCQALSEITGIVSADMFVRPIYAGNAFATVQLAERIIFATVRATSFDAAPTSGGSASVSDAEVKPSAPVPTVTGREMIVSERPDLATARVVVAGGRGVGSADNFKLIESLADKLGGAVGASRAAVDSGYIGNDHQVGQTGKIVAPDLYIAVGLSGAIQHLAGMKDSKVIVAINKDADAPIMHIADYALCADLFAVVPELTGKL